MEDVFFVVHEVAFALVVVGVSAVFGAIAYHLFTTRHL